VNASLWGMLNGIAKDAKNGTYNNGIPDVNALSLMEELAQRAEYILGSTYDASTTYTTTYYITGPTNPQFPSSGAIAPSTDAAITVGTGVTFKQAGN
jgi:hypothetical protein